MVFPLALMTLLVPANPPANDSIRDVTGVISKHCLTCHRRDKAKGGLRLDSAEGVARGGNSGAVVVPGKPEESLLIRAIAGKDSDLHMPPKPRPALSAGEVHVVSQWVAGGAKWPAGLRLEPALGTADHGKPHWAFQPIRRPVVPKRADDLHPIDTFIRARLGAEGMAPSPEADKATLLRRVWLDLTGLPPSMAEITAFHSDTRPDAYERLVDRALASPHFGERWARHWLDLARYADSDGYEKDTGRPNAYRYRDWVIDAFNNNMPFDRFTTEQLAGDLLPGAGPSQRQATGFHRNTLTNKEGGADQEQFRVEAVIDRVNTTARVFLGLTLGCSQCHDHKYDPIPQREYYEMFAFFNSDIEQDVPAVGTPEHAAWQKENAAHAAKVATLEARLTEQKEKKDSKLTALEKELAALRRAAPKPPVFPTMAQGTRKTTHVMIKGDFLRPGAIVTTGTPAVLPGLAAGGTATRLELARWLTGPEQPLTARVMANWFWSKLFGRGIVLTLEDFGTQGEPPSHPELLDYLADTLRSGGWNMKGFIREVMVSQSYRQSSVWRTDIENKDPYNRLIGRQARLRLEAETVRDVALAASGLLVPRIGGASVRPPQPVGISELTYANSARWTESKGEDRYRRGLYTWFQRTSPYPMLMTFDAPDANLCVARRERSTTPLQALTLLNDPVFFECAQALGREMCKHELSETKRLQYGMQRVAGRLPRAEELQHLKQFLDEVRHHDEKREHGDSHVWTLVARVLLNVESVPVRE